MATDGDMATRGSKIFHDPIHGSMEFDPVLVRIIDTPEFQRLRRIKQLGGGCYVYPGATHTRFEHSLGVCHLAGEFITHLQEALKEDGLEESVKITQVDIKCVKVAGLCHDLGHGPFSHMFQEFVEKAMPSPKWEHEEMSVKILEKILDSVGDEDLMKKENRELIADLIRGLTDEEKKKKLAKKQFLYQIVANKDTGIDVDKWDYFARDCHYLGLANDFQWKRCMMLARVRNVDESEENYQICYRDNAMANIYAMFRTRSTLHQKAYQHPQIKAVELMMIDVLLNMKKCDYKPQGLKKTLTAILTDRDVGEYVKLDDSMMESFQEPEGEAKKEMKEAAGLIRRLREHKLYLYLGFAKSKEEKKTTKKKLKDKPDGNITFSVIEVKFGSERDNPLGNLWFYSKKNPTEVKRCDQQRAQQIQLGGLLLPLKSSQCEVRFYCTDENAEYHSCVEAIKKWLGTHSDTFGALTGYEEYLSMTEGNDTKAVPSIRGTDIVASTTLEITPGTPLTYFWKDHGIRIHVPTDALKSYALPQTMSIQASLAGHFQLPDDMELVSAVYWVAFPVKLSSPVTVELQHCASLQHPRQLSSLSFITAKCTQKTLPYNFIRLPGGVFSIDSSYGTVDLIHFSGVAVGGESKEYSLRTYYISQGPTTWLTHFIVVSNLEVHLKVVEEVYDKKKAEDGPKIIVTIAGDEIAVDIDDEGIVLSNGWSVVPLTPPKLLRTNVESYQKGKDIPSIQLEMDWSGDKKSRHKLSHKVSLIGVEPPQSYIRLTRKLTESSPETATLLQRSLRQTDRVELFQLQCLRSGGGQVIRVMDRVSARWTDVAMALHFGGHIIDSIQSDASREVKEACRNMFQKWLAGEGKTPASWDVLIQALEDALLGELARELKEALQ